MLSLCAPLDYEVGGKKSPVSLLQGRTIFCSTEDLWKVDSMMQMRRALI